jgi:hypothetical protein
MPERVSLIDPDARLKRGFLNSQAIEKLPDFIAAGR